MTRQIKFKAWHKKETRFIDVRNINFETDMVGHDCIGECNYYDAVKFEDCELLQFTGLYDKDGKEIYEGDILNIHPFIGYKEYFHEGNIVKVKFNGWKIKLYFKTNDEFLFIYNTLPEYLSKSKIIGNIFETPELLEK